MTVDGAPGDTTHRVAFRDGDRLSAEPMYGAGDKLR